MKGLLFWWITTHKPSTGYRAATSDSAFMRAWQGVFELSKVTDSVIPLLHRNFFAE